MQYSGMLNELVSNATLAMPLSCFQNPGNHAVTKYKRPNRPNEEPSQGSDQTFTHLLNTLGSDTFQSAQLSEISH